MAFLGAAGVVVSSYFPVSSASQIILILGTPPAVIGATVVAIGTSAPELATSTKATKDGHLGLALGNIVGSCFMNTTCILGVTLMASPLRIDMTGFTDLALFSLVARLLLWHFLSSNEISWKEGAVL